MNQQLRTCTGWTAITSLLILTTGCSAPKSVPESSQSSNAASPSASDRSSSSTALKPAIPPSPKSTHSIGEAVAIKEQNLDLQFTVNGTREHPGKGVIKPNRGHKWVLVDMTIANKGKEPKTLSVVSFQMIDSNNNPYEVALLAGALEEVESPTGEISPGEQRRGEVTFEVPENTENLTLLFKPNSSQCEASTTAPQPSESLNCQPIAIKLNR
ncbi:MAG TPA: DUF4352 domain-containing protein [Cyanobacteria bacterium UBA8803]|nr:DUF4352 domain-containing protein [Cyanobacteria bacterium UBA8803]